jgi:hypothetical protein
MLLSATSTERQVDEVRLNFDADDARDAANAGQWIFKVTVQYDGMFRRLTALAHLDRTMDPGWGLDHLRRVSLRWVHHRPWPDSMAVVRCLIIERDGRNGRPAVELTNWRSTLFFNSAIEPKWS